MGAFADNNQIRVHLNLEVADIDEDMETRLSQYKSAALDYISIKLNQKLYETEVPEDEENGTIFTDSMRQCELMLIEEFYKNRGTSSAKLSRETAITVDAILNKQRKFNV